MIYFTADLHFNHAGIIKHCHRGFRNVEEMNESLIARWNDKVRSESDTVWVLGDFGFSHSQATPLGQIFHRLRGRKSLVVGNHDERNPQVLKLAWERQERLYTFKEGGRRAELCHYPLESWKGAHTGAIMLHGHCHGGLERQIHRRLDIGIDVFPDGPVEWSDILTITAGQPYEPQDGHRAR